jgi:hypothetical protein
VAVGLQGDADVGVAQALARHLGVDALFHQQGRVGVPEAMKRDAWYASFRQERDKAAGQGVGVDGRADGTGETRS